MASMSTFEAMAAVLVSEFEEVCCKMVLEVVQPGLHQVGGNLHGEVHHPIKDTP
jgi:hypothetical protein